MFPVYSVTYVPGPYPVLRSLGLLDVLQGVRLRGPRSRRLVRPALSPFRYDTLCITRARSLSELWRRGPVCGVALPPR